MVASPGESGPKGTVPSGALPVEGPISISPELILTARSHSNRSSQGEEELMRSSYWLLPLLSFWLYRDHCMGLGVSMDRITLMLTCVVLHA